MALFFSPNKTFLSVSSFRLDYDCRLNCRYFVHFIVYCIKYIIRTAHPVQRSELMHKIDVAEEVALKTSADTWILPVGEIPFKLSATSIAGPTLKKSTSMNVGAFPYIDAHVVAWSPRLPAPPPCGAFVVSI